MPQPGCLTLLAFAGLLFAASPARAHDPLQSWMSATASETSLELTITMAASNAWQLIDFVPRARLTPEKFAELRPRLVTAAPKLCLVAGRQTLSPTSVRVEYTDENDVVFTLDFPAPPPGPLRFDAAFLRRLGPDFTSMLVVADAAGTDLGWDQLTNDKTQLEVAIPARTAPKT